MKQQSEPVKVLFVCLGNICRSPTAEGMFRKLVDDNGLQHRYTIDSAGTGSWHIGSPPDSRAQIAARQRDIDLSSLRGRQLEPTDGEKFDLIIAMDENNRLNIKSVLPTRHHHKVRKMGDFLSDTQSPDVPDPYFGGDEGFSLVLDMLEQACNGLLQTTSSSASSDAN
ncbi:MAG: low molecular weight protein-tyrosine-phosphatase [Pseudomonadota bacterium]